MTVDSLEVMSETNAATAPRKNVGAIAFEKISDNRCTSGMKVGILWFTYWLGFSSWLSPHDRRKAMGETVPHLDARRGRALLRALGPVVVPRCDARALMICELLHHDDIGAGVEEAHR
jgi:hypothetical protein